MSELYLVAFDGSAPSQRALAFALGRAQAAGGRLMLAHVLEWSPYSFLTAEELAERHKRRGEEVKRAETAILEPVRAEVAAKGVPVETEIRYGHVAETLCEIATESGACQMFVGRTGESRMAARLFGSVSASLTQIAPVPCTIVP